MDKLNAYCFALINACLETNANEMQIRQENVTHLGKPLGNWTVTVRKETKEYIIWSEEHRAWWGENRCGYVTKRSEAGRYTFKEALEIVEGANIGLRDIPNEAMILITDEETKE